MPQAQTVQIFVSAGAPAVKLQPSTNTRRRYVTARIHLPLYRKSRIHLLFLAVHLPSCSSHVATASRRWPWQTETSTWPNHILPHPPAPSVLCTAPKAREVRVVKSLYFPVRDTRARAIGISCLLCQTAPRSVLRVSVPPRPFSPAWFPPPGCFFARYCCTCRRASVVTRWAPSFRRCCATSPASAATASTAAATTRSSTASTFLSRDARLR